MEQSEQSFKNFVPPSSPCVSMLISLLEQSEQSFTIEYIKINISLCNIIYTYIYTYISVRYVFLCSTVPKSYKNELYQRFEGWNKVAQVATKLKLCSTLWGFFMEKDIEQYLVSKIKSLGGRAFKFTSPGQRGVPDRIVVLPDGRIYFVELKDEGEELRPLQQKVIDDLHKLRCHTKVIDSKEAVDGWVKTILGSMSRMSTKNT